MSKKNIILFLVIYIIVFTIALFTPTKTNKNVCEEWEKLINTKNWFICIKDYTYGKTKN